MENPKSEKAMEDKKLGKGMEDKKSEKAMEDSRLEKEMGDVHLEDGMVDAGEEEDAMEVALRDPGVVTQIVQGLRSEVDRHCAALVCKVWNEAVAWSASRLVLRGSATSSLARLAPRFWHVTHLDLSRCAQPVTDRDLHAASAAFPRLRALRVAGGPVTAAGLAAFGDLESLSLAALPALENLDLARNLRVLHLEDCRALGDDALEACRELQELRLKGEFRFTSSGLAAIGDKCAGLVTLELALGATNIDLALKSVAQGCLTLSDVTIRVRARGAKLEELSRCTSLRALSLESDPEERFDEPVVSIAAANRSLTEFVCVNRLGDSAVMSLILKCPRLQKLHLDALNLTEGVLPCIQQCEFLTDLLLENFQSTGQGLAEIGLCGLNFTHFALRCARGVRDMELQMLMGGNRQLEELDLQGCSGPTPTPIGFSAIALCSRLRRLSLSYTSVDDLSLMNIASEVPELRELSLAKCEAISTMSAVARFSSLECLDLDHCSFVTDKELDVLACKCPRITHLSLASTRVTDTGLEYLSKCQVLRSLRIPYCRGVLGSGLITVAKACGWFQHVVVSHRFRGSRAADILRELCCTVRFEMDETALVPFGTF